MRQIYAEPALKHHMGLAVHLQLSSEWHRALWADGKRTLGSTKLLMAFHMSPKMDGVSTIKNAARRSWNQPGFEVSHRSSVRVAQVADVLHGASGCEQSQLPCRKPCDPRTSGS